MKNIIAYLWGTKIFPTKYFNAKSMYEWDIENEAMHQISKQSVEKFQLQSYIIPMAIGQ